jgi:hypothetical protein
MGMNKYLFLFFSLRSIAANTLSTETTLRNEEEGHIKTTDTNAAASW